MSKVSAGIYGDLLSEHTIQRKHLGKLLGRPYALEGIGHISAGHAQFWKFALDPGEAIGSWQISFWGVLEE